MMCCCMLYAMMFCDASHVTSKLKKFIISQQEYIFPISTITTGICSLGSRKAHRLEAMPRESHNSSSGALSNNRSSEKGRRGKRFTGSRSSDKPRRSRSPVNQSAVPRLKHGASNNFPIFKKKIVVAALEQYKDLARLIELGEYYEPPEVTGCNKA